MAQSFERVFVRGADGAEKILSLVRMGDRVAFCCAEERTRISSPEELEDWVVGFPMEDVRRADSGKPLRR